MFAHFLKSYCHYIVNALSCNLKIWLINVPLKMQAYLEKQNEKIIIFYQKIARERERERKATILSSTILKFKKEVFFSISRE